VVEAFLSYTSGEAFADRIGSGSVIGCIENLNSTGCRHTSEAGPKFAVVITNQILRSLSKRGGFSKLLGHPGIGRGPCDADMDHPSRLQFDEEEGEERLKEEIGHLNEKGLLPCANQPSQEHEECSVRLGASRSFHLPTEHDERLSYEGVFRDELGLASAKICE
jgi:hypothetical protein